MALIFRDFRRSRWITPHKRASVRQSTLPCGLHLVDQNNVGRLLQAVPRANRQNSARESQLTLAERMYRRPSTSHRLSGPPPVGYLPANWAVQFSTTLIRAAGISEASSICRKRWPSAETVGGPKANSA